MHRDEATGKLIFVLRELGLSDQESYSYSPSFLESEMKRRGYPEDIFSAREIAGFLNRHIYEGDSPEVIKESIKCCLNDGIHVLPGYKIRSSV